MKPVKVTPRIESGIALGLILAGLAVSGTTARAESWNINFAGRNETNEFVNVADGTDPIGMGGGVWNNVMSPTSSFSWDPASPLTIVDANGGTSINLDWGPGGSLIDHDASIDGTSLTPLNQGWFGHWDNFDQTLNFTNIPAGTYNVTVYFTWRWNEYSVDYTLSTDGLDLGTKTINPDQSTANNYNNYVEGNNFLVFNDVSPVDGDLDLHIFNTEDGGISAIQIASTTLNPTLTAVVNTVTGMTQLKNMASNPVTFDYYLVQSDAGALDAGNWLSLDDQEADAPGLGWVEAGGSTDLQLAELNLSSPITLAPNETINLGQAFDPSVFGSGLDADLDLRFGVPGRAYLSYGNVIYVDDPALPGDLDGDGFVGLNDLDLILNNWNQAVPPGNPLADPTGDGFVGLDDLDLVLNNWNTGTPPAAAVPEPASLAVGLLAAGMWMCRRH